MNANSVNIIFDSERSAKGEDLNAKFQGFINICVELGYNAFATDYHSTENYITQNALDVVLGKDKYKALTPYQNFSDVDQKWGKTQNWLMIREMSKEDFKDTELNKFIEDVLVAQCKNK